MDYKGYRIHEEKGRIAVEGVRDFNPAHIFECGQCFRWLRQNEGVYLGVARNRVVKVEYSDGQLLIHNSSPEDFINLWYEYFDLGRDYAEIKAKLRKDRIMEEAIEFGHGIRLLKQDIWETLVSFILSSNNRIPKIMRSVAALAKAYGDRLSYEGVEYCAFPGVQKLTDTNLEQLDVCKGGYRCKYIIETARMVSGGAADIYNLRGMEIPAARAELMKLAGVGPKVADCVLLYSGNRYDIFPTDVWVKRVMEELYFKREASFKEIQDFSVQYFGELAGFAQQYLFYYARENKIGIGNSIDAHSQA